MKSFWRFIFILLSIMILAGSVSGQYYFGKNKVQYTSFDWQVISTDHFRIYYYSEESELAEYAAAIAEESYRVLAARFNHEIYAPIPLIVYSNPNHFTQTNVIWSFIPESVGGFTEFMKGRVVVPYNGYWFEFEHVIRHELVHVFMLSKLGRTERLYGRYNAGFPPLWFTEGLAECWSRDPDAETDLIVRDMVINGQLPRISELYYFDGSYYLYKLGESVCNFIQEHYGADKLCQMMENWHQGNHFDKIIEVTLGEKIEELSRKWSYYLKKKYFPQIAELDLPNIKADQLTRRGYALSPVPVNLKDDTGNEETWVVYKANKVGYSAIYMMPADGDEKRTVTLLKGDLSSKYESLHLTTSSIDQFDDRMIVFSSKSKEKDVLYIYDIQQGKTISRYEIDYLAAIKSPRFSPDGKRVVFTGYRFSGRSDLYILNLFDSHVTRLTDDVFYDADPCFGSDGRSVVFSSDRGSGGGEGSLSLFRLDLDRMTIVPLTFGQASDRSPTESPDGSRILFYSDRGAEKAYNIFSLEADGSIRQLTHYITGAFNPRFGKDSDEIFFTAYQDFSFHVFKAEVPESPVLASDNKTLATGSWRPPRIGINGRDVRSVKYQTDYSLDIAQSIVTYDDVYGTIGGVQVAVSDMLGNNNIVILLSNTADEKDDFLTSFNIGLTYLRRTSRLNWGVGLYHLYDEYYNEYDSYYYERIFGGLLYASYPFSKFERLESTVYFRYSDKDVTFYSRDRIALPVTHTISFVTDNTLWEATGPLEGRRLNITVGYTYDFRENVNFNRLASIDFRHYYRLNMNSTIANRFYAHTSAGREPQRIYFGGSWSFRGYGRRHFYNRNILFHSAELRFPLINDLILSFPIGAFRLRGIRGAFFHDTGTSWDDTWNDWKGSFGTSVRFALGYLVVFRFDVSWRHDFDTVDKKARTEFFFGWNF